MSIEKKATKKRLQFDYTPEQVADIDKLQEEIGASNRAEVLRRALRLMRHVVDGKIHVYKPSQDGKPAVPVVIHF